MSDREYSTLESARTFFPDWTWLGPSRLSEYYSAERRRGSVRDVLGGRTVGELVRKVTAVEQAEEGRTETHP